MAVALAAALGAGCKGCNGAGQGAGDRAAPPAKTEGQAAAKKSRGRLVILGFDGVDPRWLERWMKEGKLPALAKLSAAHGGKAYHHLRSTNPPQSPVAWATFATGTEPGEHGIYDFIARTLDASSPIPVLPKVATTTFEVPAQGPPIARNLRTGQAFWQLLGNAGVRVVSLHVPYSFPPDPMRDGRILSGLGVPDLRETNSTFTYVGTEVTPAQVKQPPGGGVLVHLAMQGDRGRFDLEGPTVPGSPNERMRVPVEVTREKDGTAHVTIAGKAIVLQRDAFSDWVELEFSHAGKTIRGICKLLLLETTPRLRLFISPINIHPRAPYTPVSYPAGFSAQIADELKGLYKTVGWDHDTSALNAEIIDEGAFLRDLDTTEQQNRSMLLERLTHDDWDMLVWVSTATDRVAHMFYRLIDPQHPRYDAALAKQYGNAIEDEYKRMDATVAAALGHLRPDDTLLILSDHGFHGYRRGLHINQWLRRQGFLALKDGADSSEHDFFLDVDWSKTKAYALGTGQIYLNRQGREPQGIVTEAEVAALSRQIRDGLLALRDDAHDNARVIDEVYLGSAVFQGKRAQDRPDMQVAFAENYRTSWESILGGVPRELFADNPKKWSGDHAASDVKNTDGILISSQAIERSDPGIVDFAPTALSFFGIPLPGQYTGKSLLPERTQ
jgi:predicted AlkP superfamily phosphohydrolase/phosphomutase